LSHALERGYEGLRVAASAPQLEDKHWADFFDYEERLNRYLSDKAMLVLCAYPVPAPRAADVTRTHPSTIRKRDAEWEVHSKPDEPIERERGSKTASARYRPTLLHT